MSAKVLLRIAAALGLLVFAWGGLAILRRPPRDAGGSLRLPKVDPAALRGISVRQAADSTVLERESGTWRVNGQPASATAVASLVAALNDSGARTELVAQAAASHERLGVDSLHGRRLILTGESGVLLDLWLGRRGPDFEGFYVRQAGTEPVYLLRGAFAEATATTVEQWRDREVARLVQDSIGQVEVRRGRVRWTLNRSATGWTLGAAAADSAKAMRFVFQFGDVRAAGFLEAGGPQPDFTRAERSVTVRDRSGRPLLGLELDSTVNGAFWARRAADSVVFRLDGRVTALLTPDASTLRP